MQAIGLEPHEGFSAYSRERYRIEVQSATWQEADIEAGSTGMICAIHVLEHFRDPSAALVQFHDWLRHGDYLVLSVPNVEVYHRSPQGRFHFSHLYNFNRDSLILLARKA